MSNPDPFSLPPSSGGFVTPGGGLPPRQRPGCWLWGGLTCLTLVLIFAALIAIGTFKFLKSGFGKQIVGRVYQSQDCGQKIKAVREAILRYHEHTGKYPADLAALAPTYIDADQLHCQMDKNPSPTHPTFSYRQPPAGTSENAPVPLLSYHLVLTFSPDKSQTQVTDSETILCLNGALLQNEDQTGRSASGAVLYHTHTGTNTTLGPGSTGETDTTQMDGSMSGSSK